MILAIAGTRPPSIIAAGVTGVWALAQRTARWDLSLASERFKAERLDASADHTAFRTDWMPSAVSPPLARSRTAYQAGLAGGAGVARRRSKISADHRDPTRAREDRLVHYRSQIGPDALIGVVEWQARRRPGCRLINLDGSRPIRHGPTQLRVGEDEIDDLVLGPECGRSVLHGQLTVKLDDVGHRLSDQHGVFGDGDRLSSFSKGPKENTIAYRQAFSSRPLAKGRAPSANSPKKSSSREDTDPFLTLRREMNRLF
jgi:hypothetical protein